LQWSLLLKHIEGEFFRVIRSQTTMMKHGRAITVDGDAANV